MMFGKKKDGIEGVLGNMLAEQLSKKDKYRVDCEYCVTVSNSPIPMSFCSFGCKPREVQVYLACPSDCPNYRKVQHETE